jgi:hydroxypyruvate reductase/glycerate 2-kinase
MYVKKQFLETVFAGIATATPETLMKTAVQRSGNQLMVAGRSHQVGGYAKIYLFGSGKASIKMASAVLDILGDRIAGGCVVSNYDDGSLAGRLPVLVGSHPVPTEKSIAAAEALMAGFAGLSERDLFIYVLSGGSSALIEKPLPPLTLQDMQKITEVLLRSGAPIEELNIVRKHLSQVKGGRLGRLTKARGIVLVISDVIGDDFQSIGSGPLFCDNSTYQNACEVLERRGIWKEVPAAARQVLQQGRDGTIEETPKQPPAQTEHVLAGTNVSILQQLRQQLTGRGIESHIITSAMRGEAREVARTIVAMGKELAAKGEPYKPPFCLLFGGETTVTVKGSGRGGRNQEMALAALREIRNDEHIFFMSMGTDGIDGPTDAAGAMADSDVFQSSCDKGLYIGDYLDNNDAYVFFEQTGGLIKTGPTGTNLMDIAALLVT